MKEIIESGGCCLGIEFGSTRIKSVLVDEKGNPIAAGSYSWENEFDNGIWTYDLNSVRKGLQESYNALVWDVYEKYEAKISNLKAIGISAMMHGYMAFDDEDFLLVPFRTWRNTITEEASAALTKAFKFNIPQRWSIAHLYQAILKGEEHLKRIHYLTTLAGYVHWKLTGERVLGIGDASGMFPIDNRTIDYNSDYVDIFDDMIADYDLGWKLRDILPKVMVAGEKAGVLTEEGAAFLDKSGNLKPGIALCPPEGDAGTGMVATNSVAERTGNISAGTSIFAMVVMEHALKGVHEEIDVVTTPEGKDVAMVHCNNCTSDINAWADLFKGYSIAMGYEVDNDKLYETMFRSALGGDYDCGGLMGFNYFSGEPVTDFEQGRPVFIRGINSNFTFENFMRLHLYSAVSTLKYGLDILFKEEDAGIDKMYGHGGFFKTKEAGQRIMSAAIGGPVTVMNTAGEGGAWGIAVLAMYMAEENKKSLSEYLKEVIFSDETGEEIMASDEEIAGFDKFMSRFIAAFSVERAAIDYV